VAYGEENDFFAVIAIEHDIGSAAELDDPLTKFGWEIVDGTADLRMVDERVHARSNGFDCSLCRVTALGD
jgi:hypothetical protein